MVHLPHREPTLLFLGVIRLQPQAPLTVAFVHAQRPYCTPCKQEYLSTAADYLLNSSHGRPIEDIKGIWVASDDPNVAGEIRANASKYFPNVERDSIVWVSDGVEGGPETSGVATYSTSQVNLWQNKVPTCHRPNHWKASTNVLHMKETTSMPHPYDLSYPLTLTKY